MKILKLFLLVTLFVWTVPAIGQVDSTAATVVQIVDTLNTYEVGGQKYYIIADQADSLYTNIRLVVEQIKAAGPKSPIDWIKILIELLVSGTLASLFAAGTRIFNDTKNFVKKLPRSEWIVLLFSTLVGAGWIYLENKFAAFSAMELFYKTSGVFLIAVVAWRAGLSRFFQKKAPAPTQMP
jgi:hypothetical protein